MSDQQERETEEDEGSTSDTAPMLPGRRSTDYHVSVLVCPGWPILVTQGLRTLLLPGRALVGFLFHLLLPGTVFLLVLLPAAAIVYLGFLCHSRLELNVSCQHRFIQPRVHDAERCSQTAALQRLLYSDSSPCRRFWCLPRPPAPSWFGDYALCCKAPRGPPSRPARRDAARRDWRPAALTKRNNSKPGFDASEASPCREPPLGPHKVDE